MLPCLDEVDGLRWLLPRVPPGIAVILADNGSTDGSVQIARDHGATVVDVPHRGYGSACHAGLLAARADIVVVMDADGTLDPAQLDRVLDPVRDGRLDLVVGARRPVRRGAQPWHLRLANRALAARLATRTGVRLHDLGPVRAARRRAVARPRPAGPTLGLPGRDRGQGGGRRLADRRGAGSTTTSASGRSKVTGTPRGIVQAVRDMTRRADPAGGLTTVACADASPAPRSRADTVLVLAKEPLPGRAKTRLQAAFTADETATLAAAALSDTLDAVRASRIRAAGAGVRRRPHRLAGRTGGRTAAVRRPGRTARGGVRLRRPTVARRSAPC